MSKLGILLSTVFYVSIANAENPWVNLVSSSFKHSSIAREEAFSRALENTANFSKELEIILEYIFNVSVQDIPLLFELLGRRGSEDYYDLARNTKIYEYNDFIKCINQLNSCIVKYLNNFADEHLKIIVDYLELGFKTIKDVDKFETELKEYKIHFSSGCTEKPVSFVSTLESVACLKLDVFQATFIRDSTEKFWTGLELFDNMSSSVTEMLGNSVDRIPTLQLPCNVSMFETCIQEQISTNSIE